MLEKLKKAYEPEKCMYVSMYVCVNAGNKPQHALCIPNQSRESTNELVINLLVRHNHIRH